MMSVLMLGPASSVHGGVSAVVNNYYDAGLGSRVKLRYIGTMVDGSKLRKLLQAVGAYICFLFALPGYDIIHINMASDASYYRKKAFIDTAYLFHKKIVIHEHGGNFRKFYEAMTPAEKASVGKTLDKASVFIVLSNEWKKFFAPIVTKVPIQIMHNAVRMPAEGRSDYVDQNILFLGRICRDKGIAELLLAMDEIHGRFPRACLYIGGSYEEQEWKSEVEKRSKYVRWMGWIGGAGKEKLLRETCSTFVLPSYYEGQPISLMEAMSYGLASVATNVGGVPEIVSEGEGILIPAGNEKALAAALEKVLADAEYRRELGMAARARIAGDYDMKGVVDRLCEVYSEIEAL